MSSVRFQLLGVWCRAQDIRTGTSGDYRPPCRAHSGCTALKGALRPPYILLQVRKLLAFGSPREQSGHGLPTQNSAGLVGRPWWDWCCLPGCPRYFQLSLFNTYQWMLILTWKKSGHIIKLRKFAELRFWTNRVTYSMTHF